MKSRINALDHFFQSIPQRVRRHRRWIWPLFIISFVLIAPGAKYFKLDLSEEFFFQEDDPVRMAYDRFRGEFGSDESIYLVYRAKDGDVFSYQSLKAVREIQEAILNYRRNLEPGEKSPLDHVVDVTTLVNISYLQASNDALISRQFIGERLPVNKAQSDTYRRQAMAHPDYPLFYVSRDSQYGGILIRTDFKSVPINKDGPSLGQDLEISDFDITLDQESKSETQGVVKFQPVELDEYHGVIVALNEILNRKAFTDHLEYYPVGVPTMNAFVMEKFVPQINVVMGAAFLLVAVSLLVIFRSFVAIIWPLVIIAVSAIMTVAVMGWLALPMNLMVNVTVFLVLVVGVADAVHILSGYLYFRGRGQDHSLALDSAYEKSGMAVFLTSVTTAMGMLALTIIPLVPIQNFGFSAALGVLFAFIITVFVLPLMLDLWAPFSRQRADEVRRSGDKHHIIQKFLLKVEHLSYVRPNINIAIFTILGLIFLGGVSKVEVNSNPIDIFGEGNIIRSATLLVDKLMGGTQNVEVMIDTKQSNALKDPRVLNVMEALHEYLHKNLPIVTTTRSLVNVVKDSNQALNGGDEAYYRIPQEKGILAETLFLFNNANPKDRRRVVSDDYSKAHITVNMQNTGSKRYIEIMNAIQPEVQRLFAPLKQYYPGLEVTVTGGVTIMVNLIDFLSWSQIKGFGLALLVISITLFFVFQSKRIGAIAVIPNIFPIIVVFGLMGYLGIAVDVDTLIVAPLMIGIVVDDTIHFLTHYRGEVLKHGNIIEGIKTAFREVGQAITFTSIILALAFITFLGLDHQGIKNFGLLSSIAITTALAAELFFLPALLIKAKVDYRKIRSSSQSLVAEGV